MSALEQLPLAGLAEFLGLFHLINIYLEDRRPTHLSSGDWRQCREVLLRPHPSVLAPLGRSAGRRRIEELFHPPAGPRP